MNESVIQTQIRLIAFKAVNVEFSCKAKPVESELKQKFNLQLGDFIFNDSPTHFAKVFLIDLITNSEDESEIIHFKVEYHTVFECSSSIDSKFLTTEFAKISAPAIGFPYVRAFMTTLSIQAGLPPIILPSINFIQFSKELEKEETEKK
jgi:preprotein translocase subunit SecB